MEHTDANTATGDAVAAFDNVTVLAPRGRFTVELYLSSLKLEGQVHCCCWCMFCVNEPCWQSGVLVLTILLLGYCTFDVDWDRPNGCEVAQS